MAQANKCPYCRDVGKLLKGRVAGESSHLTFGYGEHSYRCTKCDETWSVCYPVPPKGHPGLMDVPNERILKVTFSEGTRGFANRTVLTAKSPLKILAGKTPEESSDPADREVAEG